MFARVKKIVNLIFKDRHEKISLKILDFSDDISNLFKTKIKKNFYLKFFFLKHCEIAYDLSRKIIIRKDILVFFLKIGEYRVVVVEKSSKIGINVFRIYQGKSAGLYRSLPKKIAVICRFFSRVVIGRVCDFL